MDRTFKLPTDEEYFAFLQASEKKPRRFELAGDTYKRYHEPVLFVGNFTDSDWTKLLKMIEKDADEFHAVAAHLAAVLGHDAKISLRFTNLGHSLTVSIVQRNLEEDELGNAKAVFERRAVRTLA